MRPTHPGRRQLGMTLIELMLALAVSTIIVGIITRVVFVQQRSFMDQIGYSETQQNARASISLLKLYVRKAGWGMTADVNSQGVVPLGACFNDTNPMLQILDCDGIDDDAEGAKGFPNGSDRLRVVSIDPNDGAFVTTLADSPVGTLRVGATVDANSVAIPATTYTDLGHPLPAPTLVVVSGLCLGAGVVAGADLLDIQGGGGPSGNVFHDYSYLNMTGGIGLTCASGYASGFGSGRAQVADFWIDRSATDHPVLRMRIDRQTKAEAFVVAYDIDDLQVQYLLDTRCDPVGSSGCSPVDTPDFVWDEICDNLEPGFDDTQGGCDSSANAEVLGMTHRERLARTVGVRIAIVARTRRYNPVLDHFDNSSATIPTDASAKLTVQNHTYAGRRDGYRRWIYRATVALRNNEL